MNTFLSLCKNATYSFVSLFVRKIKSIELQFQSIVDAKLFAIYLILIGFTITITTFFLSKCKEWHQTLDFSFHFLLLKAYIDDKNALWKMNEKFYCNGKKFNMFFVGITTKMLEEILYEISLYRSFVEYGLCHYVGIFLLFKSWSKIFSVP